MSDCKHLVLAKRNGRTLSHSPGTERQILLALQMADYELREWIRALGKGLMRPEAIVFLLLHYRRVNNPILVEELAAGLEMRIRTQIRYWYRCQLGRQLLEDVSSDVCSQAWTVLLESPHGRGIWMQICFDRFIRSLCRDVLRKKSASEIPSYDSNLEIRRLALSVESRGPSVEDVVYLREALSQLGPRQRQAFLLRHGLNEHQRTIAVAVHRSERSVRTLLKQAEQRFQAAS